MAQSGINPVILNNFSRFIFSTHEGACILGSDVKAIILSLICDFQKIGNNALKHNLELSQYIHVGCVPYSQSTHLCEVVLKYCDTLVCMSESQTTQSSGQQCQLSRGLVKLFIKVTDGNCACCYPIDISVVNVEVSLTKFTDTLYHNPENQAEFEKLIGSSLGKTQSSVILQEIKSGNLMSNVPTDNDTDTVDSILSQAKSSVVRNQVSKIPEKELMTIVPSQSSVNTATNLTNTIYNSGQSRGLTFVQVPSGPIQISAPAMTTGSKLPVRSSGATLSGSKFVLPNGTEISPEVASKLALTSPANSALLQVNSNLIAVSPEALEKSIRSGSITVVPSSKMSSSSNPVFNLSKSGSSNGLNQIILTPVSSNLSTVIVGSKGNVSSIPAPSSIALTAPSTSGLSSSKSTQDVTSNVFLSKPSWTKTELSDVMNTVTTTPPIAENGSPVTSASNYVATILTGLAASLGLQSAVGEATSGINSLVNSTTPAKSVYDASNLVNTVTPKSGSIFDLVDNFSGSQTSNITNPSGITIPSSEVDFSSISATTPASGSRSNLSSSRTKSVY